MPKSCLAPRLALLLAACAGAGNLAAQSLGGAGTIKGLVTDAMGASVPSAQVELFNAVTGFSEATRTSADGTFVLNGVPANSYQLRIALAGFADYRAAVDVRSSVPWELAVRLELAGQQTSVTVEAGAANILENKSTASDTVSRELLDALPAHSPGSGLNDAIMLTTPGVAADSNGFFHPLGDHAQVSYVIDGQPVSDQRNKVFST